MTDIPCLVSESLPSVPGIFFAVYDVFSGLFGKEQIVELYFIACQFADHGTKGCFGQAAVTVFLCSTAGQYEVSTLFYVFSPAVYERLSAI